MNTLKRYLPEKAFDKIKQLNYKHPEHLYVICDMIYRINIYKKYNASHDYIDIPKSYFRDIICDYKSIKAAFDILKENKIIECDNIFSKLRGKAYGWRFNDDYVSKLISVNIQKLTISRRIINNKNKRNNAVNKSLHKYRNHYLKTFKIDYDAAMEYLNQNYLNPISLMPSIVGGNTPNPLYIKAIHRYNALFMSINAINDGDIFFHRNKTNNRIDTNLTSLKSEFKKFIVSQHPLYQIDIVNSQPYILNLLLLNPSIVGGKLPKPDGNKVIEGDELKRFNHSTSNGTFYDDFIKTYFNETGEVLTREVIKDTIFAIMYSKINSYRRQKNIFKTVYPTILDWIENQKVERHNEFAIKLQKIESHICIDLICAELDTKNINYYTIHDAWLVAEGDIKETVKSIDDNFLKEYNSRPTLSIEKIN